MILRNIEINLNYEVNSLQKQDPIGLIFPICFILLVVNIIFWQIAALSLMRRCK